MIIVWWRRSDRKSAANTLIVRRQIRNESIFIWRDADFIHTDRRWIFSAQVGAREFQRRSTAIRGGRACGDVRGGRFDGAQCAGDEESVGGGRRQFSGGGEKFFGLLRGVPWRDGKSRKPVRTFV